MSWNQEHLYKARTTSTIPILEFDVQTTGKPREFAILMYPLHTTTVRTFKVVFTIPEEIACGFLGGVDNMVDYQVGNALFDLHKQSGWSF